MKLKSQMTLMTPLMTSLHLSSFIKCSTGNGIYFLVYFRKLSYQVERISSLFLQSLTSRPRFPTLHKLAPQRSSYRPAPTIRLPTGAACYPRLCALAFEPNSYPGTRKLAVRMCLFLIRKFLNTAAYIQITEYNETHTSRKRNSI